MNTPSFTAPEIMSQQTKTSKMVFRRKYILPFFLLALFILQFSSRSFSPLFTHVKITNYTAIHTLFETIAITVGMLIFFVSWNVHAKERSANFSFLGAVFLGVATLDLVHALSFSGMPDLISPSGPEKAIFFWLAARTMAAVGLLIVSFKDWDITKSRFAQWQTLCVVVAVVLLCIWVGLFHLDIVPTTYSNGSLTATKIFYEYGLCLICVAAALRFLTQIPRAKNYDVIGLFAAVTVMAMSEFYFTLYFTVDDFYNLMGHAYKLIAYGFLFQSIFIDGIKSPYEKLYRSEKALHESEAHFRTLFEQAAVGVAKVEAFSGRFLDVNQRFSEIVGYPIHMLKKMNFAEITYPDDRERCLRLQQDFLAGKVRQFSGEKRFIRPDQSIVWAYLSVSAMWSAGENPTSFVSVVEDQTDKKIAESNELAHREKLIAASKLSALGEMAGGIAHEINNPLSTIVGVASLLKVRLNANQPDTRKMLEDVTLLESTVSRISKIIKGLLAISRNTERDPLQPVPLTQVTQEALTLCQEQFKHRSISLITHFCSEAESVVQARPAQLAQVILNLLSNSIDAIKDQPTLDTNHDSLPSNQQKNQRWIEITIKKTQAKNSSPNEVQSAQENLTAQNGTGVKPTLASVEIAPAGIVSVRITDSGLGIKPDIAEKMMQPFFTTKEIGKGTGLGLSISKSIAEDHKGRLYYDASAANTSFVLELPAHAPESK